MNRNYQVHVTRHDEAGTIRWTDSPCTLPMAVQAANEFLESAKPPYSEADIKIVSDSGEMSLVEARRMANVKLPRSPSPGVMAFEVTQEDVETVLRQHWAKLDAKGLPFDVLAEQIFDDLDTDRVESAALDVAASHDIKANLEKQTDAAHAEIAAILQEEGYLKYVQKPASPRP